MPAFIFAWIVFFIRGWSEWLRPVSFFLGLFFLGVIPAWGDSPKVVVSIKPIHSLVVGVMQDVAQPLLLLQGNASPHTYVLRPSDAKNLHRAHVLFWVGAELETFLTRVVDNLPAQVERIALLTSAEIQRLPNRMEGFNHAPSALLVHEHEQHAQGQWDPHIWLDPENAQKMVVFIGRVLTRRFPQFSDQFQKNVTHMLQRLRQLDSDLKRQLLPVKNVPFLVYHDAYHYFERHFGLHSVGAVTLNPDRPSGAKRISKLRDFLKTSKVICLFAEPQFRASIIQTIIEGQHIKVGTLDPMGMHLDEGTEHYFQLLHTLANRLTTCLQSQGGGEGQ